MLMIAVVALMGQASAVPAGKPTRAPLDPNKVICREMQVTGSLVGGKKICMKRSEWERQSNDAKRDVDGWNHRINSANVGN